MKNIIYIFIINIIMLYYTSSISDKLWKEVGLRLITEKAVCCCSPHPFLQPNKSDLGVKKFG